MPHRSVGAVVLAAGSATRMGRNKLLLEFSGHPLVWYPVEAALAAGCEEVVVVYTDPAVAQAVAGRAHPVANSAALQGQSTSLRAGLSAVSGDRDAALLLLGDQPLVDSSTVSAVLGGWRRQDRPAAAASYDDGSSWRPPVVCARELWPALCALTGDAGARTLFDARPELLHLVPVTGRYFDVDTESDYERLLAGFWEEGGR